VLKYADAKRESLDGNGKKNQERERGMRRVLAEGDGIFVLGRRVKA
jgi:hypothetical protein